MNTRTAMGDAVEHAAFLRCNSCGSVEAMVDITGSHDPWVWAKWVIAFASIQMSEGRTVASQPSETNNVKDENDG